jgi:hypothetical protein
MVHGENKLMAQQVQQAAYTYEKQSENYLRLVQLSSSIINYRKIILIGQVIGA